jgi:hypothetical protein
MQKICDVSQECFHCPVLHKADQTNPLLFDKKGGY